ncbi:MAG: NAD(P)-dependent oxidoreductase [Cyanobacteria bacterium J06642_11]
MAKLLVTGASGFLGWNLCQIAAPEWDVYGVYRSRSLTIANTTLLKADLTNPGDLKHVFATLQPDAVIHLAAESSPNRCQEQPEASHRMNVVVSRELAQRCADVEIPFVFASSDMVFNGLNPPYKETDCPTPVNLYGEQKALAEAEILTSYPKAAVCRMPLMFGAVPPTAQSFLQPFLRTLRNDEELNLFVDEIRTPVSGTTAAHGLLLALQNVHGLLHLGGKERISRYDFGRIMADVFDLPTDKLKPGRQQDVKMSAPRPPDTSLDSTKAFSLGYTPVSIKTELEALRGRV